jgi:protoheme IX farnesyltransferase
MSSASINQRQTPFATMVRARAADYLALAKPRIAVMAMAAVTVGYLIGSRTEFEVIRLVSACAGIFCVAVSCSLLNQWYEQDTDRKMVRTADRPLAAGRVSPGGILFVGLLLASTGVTWLWLTTNILTSVLSALTIAVYVCVYTPMKRVSSVCTTVGAIPGAIPPVLGWVAAGGQLDEGAMALFLLLFAWQFPHFLAIATIYRDDYERAGLKMLPRVAGKSVAGYLSVAYACVLIPISLMLWEQGVVGGPYLVVSIIGGACYLAFSVRFLLEQSIGRARSVLLCSIVYLPAVLLTMTCDYFRLLS